MSSIDNSRTMPSFGTATSPISCFPSVWCQCSLSEIVLLRKLSTISWRLHASSSCLSRFAGRRLSTCLCGPMLFTKRPAMTTLCLKTMKDCPSLTSLRTYASMLTSRPSIYSVARSMFWIQVSPVGNISNAGIVELDSGLTSASLLPMHTTSLLCSVSQRGWYLLSFIATNF
ncbi:hypothetical protein ACHAWF_004139 [Thalassiosira exigua]